MTYTHRTAQTWLHAGESLPEAAQAALQAHLAGCPSCRRYAARLAQDRAALAGLRPADALSSQEIEQIAAGIRGANAAQLRRPPMQTRFSSLVRTLAYAALAVLLVAAFAWSINNLRPAPVPGVQPLQGDGPPSGNSLEILSVSPPPGTPLAADARLEVTLAYTLTDRSWDQLLISLMPACLFDPQQTCPGQTGTVGAAVVNLTTANGVETVSFSLDAWHLTDDMVLVASWGFRESGESRSQILDDYHWPQVGAGLTPTPTPVSFDPNAPTPTLVSAVKGGLFPNVEFHFVTDMPDAHPVMTLYRQQLSEPLTVESALQAAAALGVEGRAYTLSGEGGDETLLDVTGGWDVLRFLNFADQFIYFPGGSGLLDQNGDLPPFELQVQIAEDFLNERGLLNYPYRVETIETERGGVRFRRELDSTPVYYGLGSNPMLGALEWIDVLVEAPGRVARVAYSAHHFEPVEQAAILSAQQAWQLLYSPDAASRSMYAVLAPEQPTTYRAWLPQHPAGQEVDLYGYASSLAPALPGEPPLLTLNDWPLTGYTTGMTPGRLLHAWGRFEEDALGKRTFNVAGWEVAQEQEEVLYGVVQRQGIQAQLQAEDGRLLQISNPPENLPDGQPVTLTGVVLEDVIEWRYISSGEIPALYGYHLSCGGVSSGGGGAENANFGGGAFKPLAIGFVPTPTPYLALEVQHPPGSVVEALEGHLQVTLVRQPDGGQQVEASLRVQKDGEIFPWQGFTAALEGSGLAGIEQYHNLPVKVWGQVSHLLVDQPVITVTRYEPAYPGLQVQAWLGTEEAVTLEGQPALLLSAQDGARYVLKNTFGCGEDCRIGLPGDMVIHEGYVLPDQTIGGYPLIQNISARMAGDITDISQYTLSFDKPALVELEPGDVAAAALQGRVTIERVELGYMAASLGRCTASMADNPYLADSLYVQPVWVFTGRFDDGRRFELHIQALAPESLVP